LQFAKKKILSLLVYILCSVSCTAFASSKYLLGFGYFSQNAMNKTTKKETGEPSLMGTNMFPLIFAFSTPVFEGWLIEPQIQWTPAPRSTETLTSSIFVFSLAAGMVITESWNWYLGPSYYSTTLKGKGGTKELNNGTSTTTFAVPGRSVTTKTLALDIGTAVQFSSYRIAFGSLVESIMSNSGKRTYNLYLNFAYDFGGSSGSSSSGGGIFGGKTGFF
jgi:hypothetical protein